MLIGKMLENNYYILVDQMLSFTFMMLLSSRKEELSQDGTLSIRLMHNNKDIPVLLEIFYLLTVNKL